MTLFDIRVTTTVNRRVVGSSPTGGAKKSRETPVFLLFFTLLVDPNRRLCHTAVNWLGAPRCLRQMKRCSKQEETTSIASAPSKATMFLTERVVGSSPTGGARKKHLQMQVLFQLSAPSVHEKRSRYANEVR